MKGIYKHGVVVLVLLVLTTTASAFTEIGDNITVANNVTAQNFLGNLNWAYLLGIPTDFPNSTVAGYNGNFPNNTLSGYGNNFPNTSLPNYLLISTYGGNFPNNTLVGYGNNFPNSTLAGYGTNFPNSSLSNYQLISTYNGDFPNSTISTKTTLAQVNSSAQIGESQVTNLVTDLSGKEPTITGSTSNTFWNGLKQFVTLSSGLITDFSAAVRSNISSSSGLVSYNSSTGVISDTINQSANLYNVNGSNITTGTIPAARYMDAVNSYALLESITQVTGLQGILTLLVNAKANKTNIGEFTGGNLSVSRLDGGTNASNTTFWRGDGKWVATPKAVYIPFVKMGTTEQITGTNAVWQVPTTATAGFLAIGQIAVWVDMTKLGTPSSAELVVVYTNTATAGTNQIALTKNSNPIAITTTVTPITSSITTLANVATYPQTSVTSITPSELGTTGAWFQYSLNLAAKASGPNIYSVDLILYYE